MQEKIITLKTAQLAKEKGFDLLAPAFYGCDNPSRGESNQLIMTIWGWNDIGRLCSQEGTDIYSAPTQNFLQKWLRDTYKIHITITSISQESWQCHITRIGETLGNLVYEDFFTYEEALEHALQEALNLIYI